MPTGDQGGAVMLEDARIPGMGPILFAALTASLVGFLSGYDTSVQGGVQGYLTAYFHLAVVGKVVATVCPDLACFVGAVSSGILADQFGRKKILVVCAILLTVSGVLSGIPQYLWEFVLARTLGGLALGAALLIAPVYICEIAPEKHRGRLLMLFQLCIVVGSFLVFAIGYGIINYGQGMQSHFRAAILDWAKLWGWRWILGAEALPAALFLGLLAGIRESPRWLQINNREQEARRVFDHLLGAAKAQQEITAVNAVAVRENGRFRELLAPRYRLPLMVALFLAAFSQFSGITAIFYYAPAIFGAVGMKTTNAFSLTALVEMALTLAATFIAMAYVDRAGRKLLLAIGTAIQLAAMVSVGLIFIVAGRQPGYITSARLLQYQGSMRHAQFAAMAARAHAHIKMLPHFNHAEVIVLIISMLAFSGSLAMALGPIPGIIILEIFPTRLRGRAASVGVLASGAAAFIVAITFPALMMTVGLTATYFIYSACLLLTFLFVVFILPETKGKTLEQIEIYWRDRYDCRMHKPA